MNIFFIIMSISCTPTKIQNVSGFKWNAHDRETLNYSKKRCQELYEDSPCVRLFKKYGKQDYSVICGEKINVRSTRKQQR